MLMISKTCTMHTSCVGAVVEHIPTTSKVVHTKQLYTINNLQLHNAHVRTT
jgi:hypothetical protein